MTETLKAEYIIDCPSLIRKEQYTKTLYVSTTGNDSNDGLSWSTALATLSAAHGKLVGTDNGLIIFTGAQDVILQGAGGLAIAQCCAVIGADNSASITNSHANCTRIIRFNRAGCILMNCKIKLSAAAAFTTGVDFASSASMFNVIIDGISVTVAATALLTNSGYCIIENVRIIGVATLTGITTVYGISTFRNIFMDGVLNGLQLGDGGTGSNRNIFENIQIIKLITGGKAINIDAGSFSNAFKHIMIKTNAAAIIDQINDAGTNSFFEDIQSNLSQIMLVPTQAGAGFVAGITLLSGAAGVWGVATDIIVAASMNGPIQITGIFLDNITAGSVYVLELINPSSAIMLAQIFINSADGVTYFPLPNIPIFESALGIKARLVDDVGAKTVDVYLQYKFFG